MYLLQLKSQDKERKLTYEQLPYKRGKAMPKQNTKTKKAPNLLNQIKPNHHKAHLLWHHQKWKVLQLFLK